MGVQSLLCLGLGRTPHAAAALSDGPRPTKSCVLGRLGTGLPHRSRLRCWSDPQWDPYHAVSVLSQPLQRQQRVVRLDHNIAHLILVWENRVRLHQFLGIPGEKAQPAEGLTPPSQRSLLPRAPFSVSRAQGTSESPALRARASSQGGRGFVPAVQEQAARQSCGRG